MTVGDKFVCRAKTSTVTPIFFLSQFQEKCIRKVLAVFEKNSRYSFFAATVWLCEPLTCNRQLAKLLSGFVTGQIAVAKAVVTVAAQSFVWEMTIAAAFELSLSFRICSCLSDSLLDLCLVLALMPTGDH